MIDRVWTCADRPTLAALEFLFRPSGILLVLFVAGVLRARGKTRAALLLRALLLPLSVAFFAGFACTPVIALLPRWIFSFEPGALTTTTRYVFAVVGWLVIANTLRRWWRGLGVQSAAPVDVPERPPLKLTRKQVLVLSWPLLGSLTLLGGRFLADPRMPLSGPARLAEWLVDISTTRVASNECLASRVVEYGSHGGLDALPGSYASSELDSRGRAVVPGVVATLYDHLDADAARDDYVDGVRRWTNNPGIIRLVGTVNNRFQSGIIDLLVRVGRSGGKQPVLQAWSEYRYSLRLSQTATSILACFRLNQPELIGPNVGVGCSRAGEVCENGSCRRILGEHCTTAKECFSNACEANLCCQPLGQDCAGNECCAKATCVDGRCAALKTGSESLPPIP
jgi:hypothetical protein